MSLPTDSKARKEIPIARGFLDYFPDAVAAVAQVSFAGNAKHNPGQPLHWSRGKSSDHADCVARHLIERGTIDAEDGLRHSAKLAWRALALLQIELEAVREIRVEPTPTDERQIRFDRGRGEDPTPPTHDGMTLEERTASEAKVKASLESIFGTDPNSIHYVAAPSDPDTECRDIVALELLNLGCPPDVSKVIAGGTSFYQGDGNIPAQGYVYVAGPMRGKKNFNFPAFDAARDALLKKGYNVISPADIDRAAAFEVSSHCPDSVIDTKPFVLRDFWSLFYLAHKGGAISLLPGWTKSTGASAEVFLARWLELNVLDPEGSQYQKVYGSIVKAFADAND